ncbi:hypothetical protein MtrunA17_Chr4g0025211 [Medicago truncatula]|uniref:Uncharacterized protein n=1 Tax=Medicago truncatula TaxID=3880 RepID=A0A396I6M4_MEDTR|nr:hypothetical protein MtrunA17_Chr4g0025211 [Medicago truncatula]
MQPSTDPPFVYNSEKSQAKVTRLQKNRPPPLSIVRPPIPVQVSEPVPPPNGAYNSLLKHPLQPISGHPFVYNSENNLFESPISAFMRKFQDSMMNMIIQEVTSFKPTLINHKYSTI